MEGNDKNGPNDASGIVWAHSEFRRFMSCAVLAHINQVFFGQLSPSPSPLPLPISLAHAHYH